MHTTQSCKDIQYKDDKKLFIQRIRVHDYYLNTPYTKLPISAEKYILCMYIRVYLKNSLQLRKT